MNTESARKKVYDLEREAALPLIGSAFPYFRHKFTGTQTGAW